MVNHKKESPLLTGGNCSVLHVSSQAVLNFVLYKFGHLPQREWQIMHDLAKMFLHCLNHWKLETPTVKKQHSQGEDLAAYKVNYTRSGYKHHKLAFLLSCLLDCLLRLVSCIIGWLIDWLIDCLLYYRDGKNPCPTCNKVMFFFFYSSTHLIQKVMCVL